MDSHFAPHKFRLPSSRQFAASAQTAARSRGAAKIATIHDNFISAVAQAPPSSSDAIFVRCSLDDRQATNFLASHVFDHVGISSATAHKTTTRLFESVPKSRPPRDRFFSAVAKAPPSITIQYFLKHGQATEASPRHVYGLHSRIHKAEPTTASGGGGEVDINLARA
jgi:hypothetical protein